MVSVSTMNLDGMIESLRMAIGIATGEPALGVSVLFSGDGVVNGLKNRQSSEFEKYHTAAQAHGIKLYIDDFCMSLRNIEADNVLSCLNIVKSEAILALLSSADLHVRL